MSDDGRLDLDDLGGVIENASSIDEPADVVGEERGRTWGERLEGAGVTPWLRRHRIALATGTAAVVVVGIGATVWVRAQPPPWHEPELEVISASLDSDYGTGLRISSEGTGVAAYMARSDDSGQTVRIEGVEGPGIRATTVGPPLPTGNQKAQVVRAAFGCDDDALLARTDDYRLRLTITDAWDRSATTFTRAPSDGSGWREAVVQNCWAQAVLTRINISDVVADVDEGAGAVNLRLTVTSSLPGDVLATVDASTAETAIVPTGVGTELPAGEPTAVSGRLDVWDCSSGTPQVPQVSVPDNPVSQRYYQSAEGVAMQVFSPDRQAWGLAPVLFTAAQSSDLRRALAQVCDGAPPVRIDGAQVVRRVVDDAASTVSLTMAVDVDVPDGRLAKVGITQDPSISFPDPATAAWSLLPRGGGRSEATWTFSCYAAPQPPALDLRFVDGIRPTPLRVLLDPETVAPWVSEACPTMTADFLVESGWQLP